ncbi:hypothetical protein [Roseisolibacter agri]|uniref:Gram-negative bacterial tonB protein n=1 Tax=Roseisolibacter agri TaxID=2014610 RepID=A0AA37VAZ6_9BACT|nr:hypothetical protein [Roseisolibacter agri]GLC25933.1 hypothetical protein rosag_24460 [Roseisolibacter agri]
MHRSLTPLAVALLASVATADDAQAQTAPDSARDRVLKEAGPPACHESGIRRAAVMVPPGQTRDQLRATLARGALFPAGTEVVILDAGQLTPLLDPAFHERMSRTFRRLYNADVKIDGTLSVLLVLDADGRVREAHPNTRNNQVNRTLAETWLETRFAPYVIEGCRVPAWVHVPLSFHTTDRGPHRETDVRMGGRPR